MCADIIVTNNYCAHQLRQMTFWFHMIHHYNKCVCVDINIVTYMDSTLLKDITLPCVIIEDSIKSETLSSALQTQQNVLVVGGGYYIIVTSIQFMRHHWSDSHSDANTFSTGSYKCTTSPHHTRGILTTTSIKWIHLWWYSSTVVVHHLLLLLLLVKLLIVIICLWRSTLRFHSIKIIVKWEKSCFIKFISYCCC